jgi:hypothetical protein
VSAGPAAQVAAGTPSLPHHIPASRGDGTFQTAGLQYRLPTVSDSGSAPVLSAANDLGLVQCVAFFTARLDLLLEERVLFLISRSASILSQECRTGSRRKAPATLRLEELEGRRLLTIIPVHGGDNLQAAVDAAQYGDTLVLDAGATFGPIKLPYKDGDGWITIESAALDQLPPHGQRVGPEDADLMPKIVALNGGNAISTAPYSHNYHLIGLEVLPQTPATTVYDLVALGNADAAQQSTLDQVPHDFRIDRCYIHGWHGAYLKRGIALNSAATDVTDSYLAEIHAVGQDTQAAGGWNGPGPFRIINNYLEAAGENVMFGGALATIPNLVPSDITIRHNLFYKPLSWNINDPDHYEGYHWTVKNSFELKNAARVLVDANQFTNCWVDAQTGFAIVLTPRSENGAMPWATVQDVTFANNVVNHAGGGVNILGSDDTGASQQTQRILIRNNLFLDIGGGVWGNNGRLFQLLGGPEGGTVDVTIDHNTAFPTYAIVTASGMHTAFVFTNNIIPHGRYGFIGDGLGEGTRTLDADFPGYVFLANVLPGANAALYPADNYFPASLDDVGFVDWQGGNYRLSDSSPYLGAATDGTDIGCNIDTLEHRLRHRSP